MATAVVSNKLRKFRASVDRTPSGYPRGNARSTYAGPINARDESMAFPRVVFGEEKPYEVKGYEEVGGVFFDVPARNVGIVPGARKEAKKSSRKARTVRKDPGAGSRPSLSSMRAKG